MSLNRSACTNCCRTVCTTEINWDITAFDYGNIPTCSVQLNHKVRYQAKQRPSYIPFSWLVHRDCHFLLDCDVSCIRSFFRAYSSTATSATAWSCSPDTTWCGGMIDHSLCIIPWGSMEIRPSVRWIFQWPPENLVEPESLERRTFRSWNGPLW